MSDLGDIPRELWNLVKSVFREIGHMMIVPWHFRVYRESVGAPPIPAHLLQRMNALAEQEASAQVLADALDIIDGLIESARLSDPVPGETAAEAAARGLDVVLRMFLPIVIVCMKREPRARWWAWIPTLVAMIDDRIAAQVPEAYLADRIATVLAGGWDVLFRDHEDSKPLRVAFAAYAGALLLDVAAQKLGFEILETENWSALPGIGWESDLAAFKIGVEEDPRPLPVWMAQRTVSLRWERKKRFKLEAFADPNKFDDLYGPRANEPLIGITMVPVPAAAGGPDIYLQIDGSTSLVDRELSGGWRLRLRSSGDLGFRLPMSDDASPLGAGAGVHVELGYAPEVPRPDPQANDTGGTAGGAALSIGGFAFVGFAGGGVGLDAGLHGDDAGLAARVSKARLTMTPKSRVIKEMIKRSLTVSLDAGIMLSKRRGLVLEGGAGLELYLALRQKLGNQWAGLEVSYARIAIDHKRDPNGAELSLVGTIGVTFNLLRMSLILDGIGARMTLSTGRDHRSGNLLRLGNLDGDFVPPKGYGLKIDWGPIKGGGFFMYEPELERFSGVAEVALGSKWTLRGVGFTEPRENGGTTTLVSATFEMDVPSPGFSISGFGFLLGLHRRADANAMRDALPTGGMDALLFPPDPLGRPAELVASLAAMFPPALPDEDTHVAGVLLRGTFAGGRVVVKLGFLVQWGTGTENRTKLIIAASIKTKFPSPLDRILHIEVVGLGEYDAATGDIHVVAQLRNSRLLGGDLEGGLVLFRGDPDPTDADPSRGLFASLGGYHPAYFNGQGPQRARVDKRLRIVIERANSIKLEVAMYLAATPAAFHFGIRGQLTVKAGGFGLEGRAWLDGMINYSFDELQIDVGGSLDLILFDRTVAALELTGQLTGSNPWRIAGSVSFDVLWWSVSKSFDKHLSEKLSTIVQAVDVAAGFLATVGEPGSYQATTPGGVTISTIQRTGIWNAPEQPLRFVQKFAPLDTPIERIGPSPLPSVTTIHIDHVKLGSRELNPPPAHGEFAPGLYLSLGKDAALRAPAAERWPAGFDAAGDSVASGDDQPAVAQYDEIVVDREQRQPPARPPRRVLPAAVLAELTAPATNVKAPIRISLPSYSTSTGASTFAAAWAERVVTVRRAEGR